MSAPYSASAKSFTSTPLKIKATLPRSIPRSRSLESTGDSTYFLLSSIYHDSFELSDDDSSLTEHEDVLPISPSRNESFYKEDTTIEIQNLSAWEQWLVSKAKEERLKMQEKYLKQQALEEKKFQDETEQKRKKADSKCKIQEWLQMKREQEKQEKLFLESQKTNKMFHEEQKRLEMEKIAQEKYKEWLYKKKHEETARKLKEQDEMASREKEDRERKERADEKFQEWLKGINIKERHKHQSSSCLVGGYGNVDYPAPSFANPIPWKPIHIPQQDKTPRKNTAHRKQSGPPKNHSGPCHNPKEKASFASKRR